MFDGLLEVLTENLVIISNDIFCRGVKVKRLAKLLNRPLRTWAAGYVPMQNFTPVVREGDKDIDRLKENLPHHQKVDGDRLFGVVFQKRQPSLAFVGVGLGLASVFENGILADCQAELCQLALNPLRRPCGIFLVHSPNELDQ